MQEKAEVLAEKLVPVLLCFHKPRSDWPEIEPVPLR
jgi:hypothetical protein